jgi:hypothetical protein
MMECTESQMASGRAVLRQRIGQMLTERGRTAVDEKTRTVKVWAELAHADGKLRASTVGAGRIILREEPNAVVVPKDAVHWEGCCHVVFVRDKNYLKEGALKVFHVRKVVPGARNEQHKKSSWACCPERWWPPRAAACSVPSCSRTTWATDEGAAISSPVGLLVTTERRPSERRLRHAELADRLLPAASRPGDCGSVALRGPRILEVHATLTLTDQQQSPARLGIDRPEQHTPGTPSGDGHLGLLTPSRPPHAKAERSAGRSRPPPA